jgi:hypothetical protein
MIVGLVHASRAAEEPYISEARRRRSRPSAHGLDSERPLYNALQHRVHRLTYGRDQRVGRVSLAAIGAQHRRWSGA